MSAILDSFHAPATVRQLSASFHGIALPRRGIPNAMLFALEHFEELRRCLCVPSLHQARPRQHNPFRERYGETHPEDVTGMGAGRVVNGYQVESQRLHVSWMEEVQDRGRVGVALRESHL